MLQKCGGQEDVVHVDVRFDADRNGIGDCLGQAIQ